MTKVQGCPLFNASFVVITCIGEVGSHSENYVARALELQAYYLAQYGMQVCMLVYVCVCVCVFSFIHIAEPCTLIHVHTYMYMYMYMYMYTVCTPHVHMYMYMYVHM